jgi:DNA invertase Pin-like site-specific DNA recombinase
MKELIRLFDVFDSDRIPLVFLDMNLDTSTSQGRLLRHILAAFAEYESDVKADYTRATHRRIRAEGRPWGLAPFCYAKGAEPHTWVIDEPRAKLVRKMFRDYKNGSSANAIAQSLNAAGVTTAQGLSGRPRRWESCSTIPYTRRCRWSTTTSSTRSGPPSCPAAPGTRSGAAGRATPGAGTTSASRGRTVPTCCPV